MALSVQERAAPVGAVQNLSRVSPNTGRASTRKVYAGPVSRCARGDQPGQVIPLASGVAFSADHLCRARVRLTRRFESLLLESPGRLAPVSSACQRGCALSRGGHLRAGERRGAGPRGARTGISSVTHICDGSLVAAAQPYHSDLSGNTPSIRLAALRTKSHVRR
jgi:hypothetical protein